MFARACARHEEDVANGIQSCEKIVVLQDQSLWTKVGGIVFGEGADLVHYHHGTFSDLARLSPCCTSTPGQDFDAKSIEEPYVYGLSHRARSMAH